MRSGFVIIILRLAEGVHFANELFSSVPSEGNLAAHTAEKRISSHVACLTIESIFNFALIFIINMLELKLRVADFVGIFSIL